MYKSMVLVLIGILLLSGVANAAYEINSCTTISSPGEYILKKNIVNSGTATCIQITSDNVILNGNGYAIDGIDSLLSNGILVDTVKNITVKNLLISDWFFGIHYSGVNNGIIENNFVSSNTEGIYLSASNKNKLKNNDVILNEAEGIALNTSKDNTLYRNKVSNTLSGYGIFLYYSNNNTLTENIANRNYYGIFVAYSSNNNILNRNIANSNEEIGIYLYESSSNNSASGNNLSQNNYGVNIGFADNNNLVENNIFQNNYGLAIFYSKYNNIRKNIVRYNGNYGILFSNSISNTVYNNLFNNTKNVETEFSANKWNVTKTLKTNIVGGPYIGGNFWANPNGTGFSQKCIDNNKDGICDSKFYFYDTDYLPLARKDTIPPKSITNLANKTYKRTYINWTWKDPNDIDFSKVMIYINSIFKTNVTKGKQFYNSTRLNPNSLYKISTHTVDITGNINKTWVNKTARTAP